MRVFAALALALGVLGCRKCDMLRDWRCYNPTNDNCYKINFWKKTCQETSADFIDCHSAPMYSCEDQIKNGDETGVDCGGPECKACPTIDTSGAGAGEYRFYRIQVTSVVFDTAYWCLNELAFYDMLGNRITVDPTKGFSSTRMWKFNAKDAFEDMSNLETARGTYMNRFCSGSGDKTDGFLGMDLGAPVKLSKYSIHSAPKTWLYSKDNGSPRAWFFEGSNDMDSWTRLDEQEGHVDWMGTSTEMFHLMVVPTPHPTPEPTVNNGPYQQFRLVVNTHRGSEEWCITELAFFDETGKWLVTDDPSKAFESSTMNNLADFKGGAFRGEGVNSRGNYCSGEDDGPGSYIGYDFGKPVRLSRYRIHGLYYEPMTWELQGSDDGKTWEVMDSQDRPDGWFNDQKIREFPLVPVTEEPLDPSKYEYRTSGKCQYKIETVNECNRAARALAIKYPNKFWDFGATYFGNDRNFQNGCTHIQYYNYDYGQLYVYTGQKRAANCNHDIPCICRVAATTPTMHPTRNRWEDVPWGYKYVYSGYECNKVQSVEECAFAYNKLTGRSLTVKNPSYRDDISGCWTKNGSSLFFDDNFGARRSWGDECEHSKACICRDVALPPIVQTCGDCKKCLHEHECYSWGYETYDKCEDGSDYRKWCGPMPTPDPTPMPTNIDHNVAWKQPVDSEWLQAKPDEHIQFNWTGRFNVWKFPDEAAFKDCNFSGASEASNRNGPYVLKYSGGNQYFGSNSGNHCKKGVKITISEDKPPTSDKDECEEFSSNLYKCTKLSKKKGLTCYPDVALNKCRAANNKDVPCKVYKSKKQCKKIGGAARGCKYMKFNRPDKCNDKDVRVWDKCEAVKERNCGTTKKSCEWNSGAGRCQLKTKG